MNGHLRLEELKNKESQLFGGTDNGGSRSELIIRLPNKYKIITSKEKMVPHHERSRGMKQEAISPKQPFEVILSFLDDTKIAYFRDLFLIATLLGGVGRRVRRGMGSWKVLSINGEKYEMPNTVNLIYTSLLTLTPNYILSTAGNKIHLNYSGKMEYYPWINEIEIGKIYRQDLLYHISEQTHNFKSSRKYGKDYEASLGHATRGRFASPIFVSTLEIDNKLMPIITTLNTIPDKAAHTINPILQRDFKNSIL